MTLVAKHCLALGIALFLVGCEGDPPAGPAGPAPSPEADRLIAGFLAKSLCSGLWVNGRERGDFLARDVLLGAEALGRIELEVDEVAHRVTARPADGGGERTAVFHATHGCTILPEGAEDVSFDTTPVASSLPPAETVDWPLGDRGAVAPPAGADAAMLDAAVELAFAEEPGRPIATRAFLVVQRGLLVAERYAPGFDRDSVMIGWSMGKSVTAALVGVAVARGWLELEQPAPVDAWRSERDRRSAIRVIDLLQMSSGLQCPQIPPGAPGFFSPANDHFYVYFAPVDVYRYVTERAAEHPPGRVGRYRNCDPLTLGGLLRRIVEERGDSFPAFARRELFDRIGARSMVLELDHRGNPICSGYDHATARDWARFGLLHLRDGRWLGRGVLPEGWARLVAGAAPAWPDGGYGGLFWLNRGGALPRAPRDAYFAAGAFGQLVVILPSQDLVVVRLGYSPDSGAVRESMDRVIERLLAALGLETAPRAA